MRTYLNLSADELATIDARAKSHHQTRSKYLRDLLLLGLQVRLSKEKALRMEESLRHMQSGLVESPIEEIAAGEGGSDLPGLVVRRATPDDAHIPEAAPFDPANDFDSIF